MRTSSKVFRFRDESVGVLKRGKLEKVEFPKDSVLLYECRIGDDYYCGIRVFPKLAKFVSLFSLKEREIRQEIDGSWSVLREFLGGSSPEPPPDHVPVNLSLMFGFSREVPFNYSAVFSPFGTFTFVEADTEEVVGFGFPVRDLKGMELSTAVQLFVPPRHSFLSLRLLNLI